MVIIFTENDELNLELEKNIEGSRIAFYTKYLLEEKEADILECFVDVVNKLRKRNIRVILLLGKEDMKEVEIAIRLGIYDLIFGTFRVSDVLKLVENENHFSDIADIYEKVYMLEGGKIEK